MPKTQTKCPNCRRPILADIEQLFDVSVDPSAKQRLLSGNFNIVRCPNCGYEGVIPTPIVYHDPKKELLLTYFPPELALPLNEQERMIGPLLNQVMTRLPQEQRKGYLFRPQSVLTIQGLGERILEADGITREMIQAQQKRMNLLQRLLGVTDEALAEIATQEDQFIDGEFFNLLTRLAEAADAGGDRASGQKISDLQQKLLPITTVGKKLQEQSKEIEAAIRSLQEAGSQLTREKLLELVIRAPNDTRVSVLTSLARAGMDYSFFQMLSERIDRARGEGRERLIALRERLLELTQEIDRQMETRTIQVKELIERLIKEEDISKAAAEILPVIDELFVQTLQGELATARKNNDSARIDKLQAIVNVLQQASAPPKEITLIEELLDVSDDTARRAWLNDHREEITPEFMDTLTALLTQTQNNDEPELLHRLQDAYRSALRFSMEANLKS